MLACWSISWSTTLVQTEKSQQLLHGIGIGWIVNTFCADIHGAQSMNPNDFGDPLHPVPQAG